MASVTPQQVFHSTGIDEATCDLLAKTLEQCIATQRAGSVVITIKCKPEKDTEKIAVTATVKGNWPIGENEAHAHKTDPVEICKRGADDDAQQRIN